MGLIVVEILPASGHTMGRVPFYLLRALRLEGREEAGTKSKVLYIIRGCFFDLSFTIKANVY